MKHLIGLTLVLALGLAASSSVHAADETDDETSIYYFEFQPNPPHQRINYFAPGDFVKGLPRARELINSVESNHLKPAYGCVSERNARCARHELDFVLRWVPNHPRGLSLLSKLAIDQNKPEMALPYLDFAIEQYPEHSSTYIIYGIHRYRTGEYASAARRFRQAIEHSPDSASAHYNLGLALVQQDRLADAREHARRAYDLGYPLPGLKTMLRERGAWPEPDSAAP